MNNENDIKKIKDLINTYIVKQILINSENAEYELNDAIRQYISEELPDQINFDSLDEVNEHELFEWAHEDITSSDYGINLLTLINKDFTMQEFSDIFTIHLEELLEEDQGWLNFLGTNDFNNVVSQVKEDIYKNLNELKRN